ncbi:hypothetical protein K0T92_10965 [Paenibacillus oenotherae]|uniref:DUF2326 domain-containing protein n=1 Tax=Paenibacillus oenotherae TaxID=1435645 RepID=A0ABS7D7X4_9BACL|nr:hypothetical protein [Paenibacillus oenotherae]MBW7475268.1 hypothetical protein [Paenibacillus oenotherae]
MKSLTINYLIIYEYHNRLAKRVDFQNGINVITSDKVNGNDVGKSILMKSIYHTLGADSHFDSMWTSGNKTFLMNISVEEDTYIIYRSGNLFKIYSEDFQNLFNTINRSELSTYLSRIFDFCVKLPNRNENLEITPPVYSYLLNFVDQDHMSGTKFSSFKGLGQYSDYKENVIYNHFGIFTEEYFDLLKLLEDLKKETKSITDEKMIIESMLLKVKSYLEGMDAPRDLSLLNVEIEKKKDEYSDIVYKLKKLKNNLINIRNSKVDLEMQINELKAKDSSHRKNIKITASNVCPVCSNEVNELEFKIKNSSRLEDFYIMKDELEHLLIEVDRQLRVKEDEYKNLLELLHTYESSLKLNELKISNSIKHMGYLETQENLIRELGQVSTKLLANESEIEKNNKLLKQYNLKKKDANTLYEQYMLDIKVKFGLEEIGEDKIKNITNNYEARGSNRAIATIVWFFNLLKIKAELNPDAIKFPLVLDSPNNVESDDTKENALFEFIFSNKSKGTQLILSTLGFSKLDFPDIQIDNIIELKNEKYHLLNNNDYEANEHILKLIFKNE